MAEWPLTVAGGQLLLNGLLPGAGVCCGAGQRWSMATPACARLLASVPRAAKCHSRKQPVRSISRSGSRPPGLSGASRAGGRGSSGRRDRGGAANWDHRLRRRVPGAHPTASLWPPGWPRMDSGSSWHAWWQEGLQAERCRVVALASAETSRTVQ